MLQLQPTPTLPFSFFFGFFGESTMDYGVQFAVERSSFCNCSLGWKICLLLQDSWELFFGCILQSLL